MRKFCDTYFILSMNAVAVDENSENHKFLTQGKSSKEVSLQVSGTIQNVVQYLIYWTAIVCDGATIGFGLILYDLAVIDS